MAETFFCSNSFLGLQQGGPAPTLAAHQRLQLLALAQQDWIVAAAFAYQMRGHSPELAQAGFDAALEGVKQFEQSRPKGWSLAVCQGFYIDGSPCSSPAVHSGCCDTHKSQGASSSSSSSSSPSSSISSNDGIKLGNGCVMDFLHTLNCNVCTHSISVSYEHTMLHSMAQSTCNAIAAPVLV